MNERPQRILRLPEVEQRTGRKRSAIYADPDFPAPVPIGPRAVGWLETEIDSWLERCIAERTNPTKPRSLPLSKVRRPAESQIQLLHSAIKRRGDNA
jgi:prophage regulatory protein